MLKHVRNYFFSNIATKALGIITIPIYTYLLNPEDYGMVSLYIAYCSIGAVLLTANTHTSVSRYYFEEKEEDFKVFVSTSIYLSIVSTVLFGSLALLYMFFFPINTTLPYWAFGAIILTTFAGILNSIFMQIHLPANNSKLIARTTVIAGYGQFVIAIIAVLIAPEPKWIYLVFAKLFGVLAFSTLFFKHIKDFIVFRIDLRHFRYILNYSIPLIPYALGGVILTQIDRIMISSTSSVIDTGLYSIAIGLAMLVRFVGLAIDQAWLPTYFKYMDTKNYTQHDKDCKRNLIYWSLTVAVFILLFLEPSRYIIDNKFHDALTLIPIVILGYLFEFYFKIYGKNIGYLKKTVYSSIVYLSAGIINIILNYFTLDTFGYQFAAYNTVISFMCLFILAWIVSKYIIKLHTLPLVHLWPSFLTVLSCCCVFYINEIIIINEYLYVILKYNFLLFILLIVYKESTKELYSKF